MPNTRALGRRATLALLAITLVAVTAQADYVEQRTDQVYPGGVGVDLLERRTYVEADDVKMYVDGAGSDAGVYQETNGCDDMQPKNHNQGGKQCEADRKCAGFAIPLVVTVPNASCADPLLP